MLILHLHVYTKLSAIIQNIHGHAMKHFVLGIVMIVLGVWGMFAWWENFGRVMRGLMPFLLLAMGLIALLSSYYRFVEQDREAGGDDTIDEEGRS